MYFKFSLRYNAGKQQSDANYRLVESYRNAEGRVCHRTILNIGFIADAFTPEQLNQTARLLTNRYELKQSLFTTTDSAVTELAAMLWQRIVDEKRLDLTLHSIHSRKIDADTMQQSNVKEIGSEWICHQTAEELEERGAVCRKTNIVGHLFFKNQPSVARRSNDMEYLQYHP
jgi:hypothetical protein